MSSNPMTPMWDQRYSQEEYVYGETPNEYLKEKIQNLMPAKALFPAEGEGRNAVYAATLGWAVSAFDLSAEGQKKALKLAEKNQVTIDYRVGSLDELNYSDESFDLIVLIFAHFPANLRSDFHHQLSKLLKKDGILILEGFSKNNLEYVAKNPQIGGPKDIEMLFSVAEIRSDFPDFEIIELQESVVNLEEGAYHVGKGSVIRFMGKKK